MMFYCIIHDEWTWNGELYDESACILTSCPPPILPENWIDLVTEPSAEELEQMDANAEELLAEVVA